MSWFYRAYAVLAVGYVFYAGDAGLAGWLVYFEMELMGTSDSKIPYLLAICLVLAPLLLISILFDDGAEGAAPAKQTDTSAKKRDVPWTRDQRWKAVLVTASLAAAIPSAIYGWEYWNDRIDQTRKIFSISAGDPIPSEAKFLDLRDIALIDEGVTLRSKIYSRQVSSEHYAAVVTPKFTPGDPVSLFLKAYITPDMPNRIQVRIERNALPVYIGKQFEKQEVKVASPNYVLRRVTVKDGHVVSSKDDFQYLLWLALGLAGGVLLLGGPIAIVGPTASELGAQNGVQS